ncbi:HNH endonuclease signature motif containing protein [Nocardioides sp. 1609]|uniref:HNH endonuclease n=1 Tax=Nocardioides sp. 1609 TaxID=2508327 RepID=UPI001AD9B0D1|nr:HNH endonuclease signature motif containing protein [Nocardioides sp. 1609]
MSEPAVPTGLDVEELLDGVLTAVGPVAPWLIVAAVCVIVLRFPMLGRGPGMVASRDPWRRFQGGPRRLVIYRAAGRCEGGLLWFWGRCSRAATEADHVYPHSRGGPTVPSNGQALCHRCNRAKAATRPAWWYIRGLERRRRAYFPAGSDVRVSASMSTGDRAMRLAAPDLRRGTRRR